MGPAFWITTLQFYLVQLYVARRFIPEYSWAENTISDLGATACGFIAGRTVCSPDHVYMNISLVMLGVTMALGSAFIYEGFIRRSFWTALGFTFLVMAGIGTVMVGLFPENEYPLTHAIGAALPFLIGNFGLLILGLSLEVPRFLRAFTIFCGIVSLEALAFLAAKQYLGIGIGGMERLVSYPQTTWFIIFGIYVSADRLSDSSNRRRG